MIASGPVQKEEKLYELELREQMSNVNILKVFLWYGLVSQTLDPFTSFPRAFGHMR